MSRFGDPRDLDTYGERSEDPFGPELDEAGRDCTAEEEERLAREEAADYREREFADYGGAFDGFTVTSDADPGL